MKQATHAGPDGVCEGVVDRVGSFDGFFWVILKSEDGLDGLTSRHLHFFWGGFKRKMQAFCYKNMMITMKEPDSIDLQYPCTT